MTGLDVLYELCAGFECMCAFVAMEFGCHAVVQIMVPRVMVRAEMFEAMQREESCAACWKVWFVFA
jgi:hypothetical protein